MTASNQKVSLYFDNAATTFPKPEIVWQTMDEFARSGGANANRGQNPLARRAARMVEETRNKVANWLEVPADGYITFAPSATVALNQVILGLTLPENANIYVSPFEHNSILRSVNYLMSKKRVSMREIPFHPLSLEVDWNRLEIQWREAPPSILAISQASNVCGLLLPVEKLATLARKVNPEVVVVVDGAQAAGLYPLELKTGLVDFLIWSGHKSFYGPFGVAGIAFCSQIRPEPILFGGTGTFSEKLEMPDALPSAYEPGSLNSVAIAGLGASLDWLADIGRATVVAHTARLTKNLEQSLSNLSGVRVFGLNLEKKASVFSLTMAGVTPQALEEYLGNRGIAVRAGLHCAPWAHRLLGTLNQGGTIRFSPGYFNTENEIEQVVAALEALLD